MNWPNINMGRGQRPGQQAPTARDVLRAIGNHVRPDFRKTVAFGLAALIALIVGHDIGGVHAASEQVRLACYGCGVLVAIFGLAATRTAAREVQRVATERAGDAAATPLRFVVLITGYVIAVVAVCDLCGVDIRQLLVGGAITGIVVGLAAQPVLSNLFAGLVLLFARPYVPGQHIRVLSGAINGPHDGVVISAGVLYTTLDTANGPLSIPNSTLLAAAVGPAPVATDDAEPVPPSHDSGGLPVQPLGQDEPTLVNVFADAEAGTFIQKHLE